MARKTKAELQAEREAMLAQALANEQASYPARLMQALEEATTKNNFELQVRDGMFNLRDRDSRDEFVFAVAHNPTSQSFLENLEWELQSKAEERAEAERLSNLRRQAFAKLSDEEKHALGLNDRNNW